MERRTSKSHPLRVDWIVEELVGLTFAPGKKSTSGEGFYWDRDLLEDLAQLRTTFRATVLVTLIEDQELTSLGIPDLVWQGRRAGLDVLRLPIRDGSVPADPREVRRLVDAILERADAGKRVVIHCMGGLGRAGTIGGCVLAALGAEPDLVLETLVRARRDPRCPENDNQKNFIRSFAKTVGERPVARPRPLTDLRPSDLSPRADRFLGTVWGAALGDAIGYPVEFLRMDAIYAEHGPQGVTGPIPSRDEGGRKVAIYSDDTQMAEAVLRCLIASRAAGDDDDGLMRRIATSFVSWMHQPQGGHRAPGNACLAGCRALDEGAAWSTAGGATAGGCGSVMRAYPFGLAHWDDPDRAAELARQHSKLTHRDPIALAASAAMAKGIALCISGAEVDATLTAMIAEAAKDSAPTAAMIERAVEEARTGVASPEVLERLEGWAAHEAIAAGCYVFARHPNDARAAILEGANSPGDSDSIATLAGALVGARVGARGLPAEWIDVLERARELGGAALALAAPSGS